MTDETPPKIRGKKEREAAYRQGFLAGLAHALREMEQQRSLETLRDLAIADGLKQLQAQPAVRRRRRRKSNSVAVEATDGLPGL